MNTIKELVTYLDFFSLEAHFTFNEKGEKRIKTIFGGFLSLLYILAALFFTIYFIIRLLTKKDLNVMYSSEKDFLININYSNKLPFMVRLSDYYRHSFSENLYDITLKIWYNFPNKTLGDYTIDIYDNVILEKCDLNKHFGEYKEYFKNLSNINSYFCPKDRLKNQTLYGVYGDSNNFSFYYFYFTKCKNTTNKNNCLSNEEITKKLTNSFLDIIYIDFSIDNLNIKTPQKIIIKSERFIISSTVYKRIWLFLRQVKYITDYGLITTRKKEENFHQFDSLRFDTDLRDIDNAEEPGTFLTVSIGNSGDISVYNRKFNKIQDYLANICGFIKGFTFLFKFLNYHNAKNCFYKKIIKDFLIENKISQKFDYNKKNIGTVLNNSDNFPLKNIVLKSPPQNHNKICNLSVILKEKKSFEKKYRFSILPLGLSLRNKENLKTIKWYIKVINNRLNVISVLNKLEFIEKIKGNFCFNCIEGSPSTIFKKSMIKENEFLNKKNNFLSSDDVKGANKRVIKNKYLSVIK